MSTQEERIVTLIKERAAAFLGHESVPGALITVTRVILSKNLKNATIFFTVYPEKKEVKILETLKRRRSDFREHAKKNMSLKHIPFFEFAIDMGEKNRQRIDELSRAEHV